MTKVHQLVLDALDHIDIGVSIIDSDLKIVHFNSAIVDLYGFPESMVKEGQPFQGILMALAEMGVYGDREPEYYVNRILKSLRGKTKYWRQDLTLSDGRVIDVRTHKLPGGGYSYHHQDVTEERNEQKKLLLTDRLTGLPNLDHLGKVAVSMLDSAIRERKEICGIRFSLDRFQTINRVYGADAGSSILKTVSDRLRRDLPDKIVFGRGNGNEFFVAQLCPDAEVEGRSLIEIIRESMKETVRFDNQGEVAETVMTVSAGIVRYPHDGIELGELLRKSDLALQIASQERNSYHFFDWQAARRSKQNEDLIIENDIRIALEERQFELYYQPQIDLDTNKLVGVEALIRWLRFDNDKKVRMPVLSPEKFIPIAEDSGLVIPMGNWVLGEACRQAKSWQEAGYEAFKMSVNVSVVQFRQRNFVAQIEETLEETGLLPEYLELEVTETVVAEDVERIRKMLESLKSLGVGITLDDFGTGYSSLSYLTSLPFDKLKIDQAFVRQADWKKWEIVRAVIDLSKTLGLDVVAEGVETLDSLNQLRDVGCHIGQGYYFSKPISPSDFELFIRDISGSTQLN